MKYKHIIFDIDGTLLDTEYAVLHSLQDTLRDLTGKTYPIPQLTFALGITGKDALERLSVADIPAALKLWDNYMKHYSDTVTVFAGIPELLNALSESGYELGIVTSKTGKEYETEFCCLEISRYFKYIISADDTAEHKPAPAPLLKYLERSGAERNQLLYIGDSRYDSECAKNAGIDFALAVWGSHTREIPALYALEKPDDLFPLTVK